MKRSFNRLAFAVIGGLALVACSAQQSTTTAQATKTVSGDAAVRKAVAEIAPGAKIDALRPAPIAGMTEVTSGGQLVYITNDGKYLISGNIVEIAGKRDLTEMARAEKRRELLGKVAPNQMVVFGPEHPKYTVTVFTDVDCTFCRKLHSQIADYNKEGIRVDYLFFPRAGIGSESYDKAVSVWCASDRQQALTDAKKGLPVPKRTCQNPVVQDYDLGREFGFDGTPAIYTADGAQIGGYLSPADLKAALDKHAAKPNS